MLAAVPVLEISDLVVAWDPRTGEQLPVRRDDVLATLRAAGDTRAARIAARMPVTDGFLDPAEVNRLLVRVHTELQRLNEELHMARRFAEVLRPMLVGRRRRRRLAGPLAALVAAAAVLAVEPVAHRIWYRVPVVG